MDKATTSWRQRDRPAKINPTIATLSAVRQGGRKGDFSGPLASLFRCPHHVAEEGQGGPRVPVPASSRRAAPGRQEEEPHALGSPMQRRLRRGPAGPTTQHSTDRVDADPELDEKFLERYPSNQNSRKWRL